MMKKNLYTIISALVVIFLFMASYSCSTGRYLRTEAASSEEIAGDYTLILYGGNSANDLKTIAILAKEGTPYSFEVFAPEFDYRLIKGVPAKEALEKAEKFVGFHPDFWKVQLSRIADNHGNTIGYEVRPLYYPTVYGQSDILDVYYKKSGDKVIVYIRLYQYLRTMPFEDGKSFRFK